MSGRGAGPCQQVVQLIEIPLRQVTRAHRILVLDCNGNDTALLVVGNGSEVCETLGRAEAIAFAVELLQVKAVNQMATDGPAFQKILVECSSGMTREQASCRTTQAAKSAGAAGESRK